jgi:hypothetical protein
MERKIAKVESAPEEAARLGKITLARDTAWLQLPIAKKEVGLERLRVMVEYDSKKVRTKAEARAAADQLGIKLRSFYALLKQWREAKRAPSALVPFGSPVAPRRSRLGDQVASKLRGLAEACITTCPSASTGELVARIKAQWNDTHGMPSDVTIRSYVDRAREKHRPFPGAISAESLGFNKQPKARGFGDVLIVDHTAPADILVFTPEGAMVPAITLVIDEFTGAPIGQWMYDRYPDGDAVVSALANTKLRLSKLAPDCDLKASTVVFASTFDREWRGLGEELVAQGYFVNERIEHRLAVGQAVRQFFGNSLGTVALQSSRAAHIVPEEQIDPERKALLSLKSARAVVVDAVEKQFMQRVQLEQRRRNVPADTKSLPFSKTMELRDGFSFVDPDQQGREPRTSDADTQRLEDEFLRLSENHAKMRPIASAGSSPEGRSPGVFRRRLERLSREIAGQYLIAADVTPPRIGHPAWHLSATVNDPVVATPVWLELAREAVSLADLELTFVQVTVEVQVSDD